MYEGHRIKNLRLRRQILLYNCRYFLLITMSCQQTLIILSCYLTFKLTSAPVPFSGFSGIIFSC